MNIRRIEAGILDSGSDFDTSMTPFEAGLERFIDLKKDQFIGKEALLSAKRGKRLYGLTCKDLTPCRGDAIFAENVQVGVVTTGAQSPFLAAGIGYVRFYEAGAWPGKKLLLYASGGGQFRWQLCEILFVRTGEGKGEVRKASTMHVSEVQYVGRCAHDCVENEATEGHISMKLIFQ